VAEERGGGHRNPYGSAENFRGERWEKGREAAELKELREKKGRKGARRNYQSIVVFLMLGVVGPFRRVAGGPEKNPGKGGRD